MKTLCNQLKILLYLCSFCLICTLVVGLGWPLHSNSAQAEETIDELVRQATSGSDAASQKARPSRSGDATQPSTPQIEALDLIFVIDNSGSMKKNDPKFITPNVVSTFVKQLPIDSQVGMVLFDQRARLLTPLTLISNLDAQQQVIDSLKKIDYRGQRTNTPVGIERALYELKTNGRKGAQKGIIFITDGIVDTGNIQKDQELTQWLKEDITAQCKQRKIRIFGIALTEAADFSLIQALASRTQGEYFRTFEAAEISGVLDRIQSLMTPPKPELAPLPLLPVPPETPKPEKTEKVEEANVAAGSTPATDQKDQVVITEKSVYIISIAIILIIAGLIGVLLFFFIQNTKRRQIQTAGADEDLNLPEAELEDLDKILGEDQAPYKLEQSRINIGRSQRNDMIIENPAVSSFHATIEFRNMSFYLEDQRSTNGTMLNGQRLAANDPVRLKGGDSITFAKFRFVFNIANQKPFGDTVMLSMTALEDPEAEATVVLDLDGADSKQGLISCIQNHLMQIYGLSPKHRTFVNTFFAHDVLDIIATTAHENLQKTMGDYEQHCSSIIKNNAFYVVCSLPGSIDSAAQWYGDHHNGYTQFIFKWVRSDQYKASNSEQLCLITFGQDPATWVSITIVPTHSDSDPVEIMSVDFLNEEEKSSLALDFDNHGRVI